MIESLLFAKFGSSILKPNLIREEKRERKHEFKMSNSNHVVNRDTKMNSEEEEGSASFTGFIG